MNVVIEIGEFKFAEPAFRTASRIVAITNHDHVRFALQYQSEDEPGAWLPELSFPWYAANLDKLIRASARYHDRIERVLKGEKMSEQTYLTSSKKPTRFTITITESDGVAEIARYAQTVDAIDMQAIINAVNRAPQPQRERRVRSDAGKPRKNMDTITATVDGDVV